MRIGAPTVTSERRGGTRGPGPRGPSLRPGASVTLVLARHRTVLRTPLVARVMLTGLLARLPGGMCALAILLLVREHSGSFVVPGLAVGAYGIAGAITAPLQGRLVDRFGRARVVGPSVALWAAMLVALVLAAGAPAAVPVVLAFCVGACLPPFPAVVRACVGELIGDDAVRESAYALDAITQELVWLNGPLLVALAVAVASPAAAVLLTGAIGVVGAIGLLTVAPGRRPVPVDRHARRWAGALASPGLLALIVPVALVGVSLGATEVGLPALAVHAGHRAAAGVLLALWSVGSLIGGLLFATRGTGGSLGTRYRVLILGVALGQAPLIAARSLWGAGLLAIVAGVSIAPYFGCLYALIGRLASAGTSTEAFTWMTTAVYGGAAVGAALAGALSSAGGVSAPFELAVGAGLFAAALTWTALGRPLHALKGAGEPGPAGAAVTPV